MAFDAFTKAPAEAERASDILRTMSISTMPIVQAIMMDNVSAFSIWFLDHPDLVVDLEGRKKSALTLACAANAKDCINSMLLRGFVPGWRANQAAVQTGDTALMRKIDNATPDEISRFRASLCAALMEFVDVTRFFGRKVPRFVEWLAATVDGLPLEDLSLAYTILERAALQMDPHILVFWQRECDGQQVITEAIVTKVLAGRPGNMIERIVALGNWTDWRTDLNVISGQFSELESLDLSGGCFKSIGP
jgi:hypothetical protein